MNEAEFLSKLEAISGVFTASFGRAAVIIDANTARIVELEARLARLEQRLPAREPACEAPTPADCLAEQLGRHGAG